MTPSAVTKASATSTFFPIKVWRTSLGGPLPQSKGHVGCWVGFFSSLTVLTSAIAPRYTGLTSPEGSYQ